MVRNITGLSIKVSFRDIAMAVYHMGFFSTGAADQRTGSARQGAAKVYVHRQLHSMRSFSGFKISMLRALRSLTMPMLRSFEIVRETVSMVRPR